LGNLPAVKIFKIYAVGLMPQTN